MKFLSAAFCLTLLPCAALGQDLVLRDGYVRSTNPRSGAAFMVIENQGQAACTLSAAASEAAQRVELHGNREEGGMMRMVKMDPVAIPAGGRHELVRGGEHLMLMGLNHPLAEGEEVDLVLDFGTCGKVGARLPVRNGR